MLMDMFLRRASSLEFQSCYVVYEFEGCIPRKQKNKPVPQRDVPSGLLMPRLSNRVLGQLLLI